MQSSLGSNQISPQHSEEIFYKKNSYQNTYEPVLYYVKPGDTLSQIITNYYGINYGSHEYGLALEHVLFSNKDITNANTIQANQIINLTPMIPSYGPMCLKSDAKKIAPASQQLLSNIPSNPQERDFFWTLAWLQSNYNFLSTAAGATLNSLGGLTGKQNTGLILDVDKAYKDYQAGKITKGAYDYKRKVALENYSKRVGPFEKLLFSGKNASQAIRINRTKALPANANVMKYASRLNSLAKLATHGGLALTFVGVANGADDMCQAKTRQEKNEIFIDTLGGAVIGAGLSAVVGTILIVNPLFWGATLVLGTASAVGGYYGGKGLKKIYNLLGEPVDFVSLTKAEAACNLTYPNIKPDTIKHLNSINSLRTL